MIVIFSPYPYESLRQDGMFRRIYIIDSLFKDYERVYVYNEYQGDDYEIRQPFRVAPNTFVQLFDFRFAAHHIRMTEILDKAEFIYAQTMIFSSTYLYPYYNSGKIITDAHGVAGEEERMVDRFQRGDYIEAFESFAVNNSSAVVVVTKAMESFYRSRFGGDHTEFIHLPINVADIPNSEKGHNTRKKVVYAGGLHKWQNVEDMLNAVLTLKEKYEFIFLTNEPDTLRDTARKVGAENYMTIESVPHERVADYLNTADYGFVLRDDSPVNYVAFPTKLIEYLSYKVIPIMKSPEVGDFNANGGKYIKFQDFLSGNMVSDDMAEQMRSYNYELYRKTFNQFEEGKKQLVAFIEQIKNRNFNAVNKPRFVPTVTRTSFLPLDLECLYQLDKKENKKNIDIALYPYMFKVDVSGGHIDNIIFTVINKNFVCKLPLLKIKPVVGEAYTVSPINTLSFDKKNNIVCVPGSYFQYAVNANCCEFEISIDICLYGIESFFSSNNIPQENSQQIFERIVKYYRKHGTLNTIKKIIKLSACRLKKFVIR